MKLSRLVMALVTAALGLVTATGTAAASPSVGSSLSTGGDPTRALQVPPAAFSIVDVPGTTGMDAAPRSLLAKYGYVEQEFYVSGTACRYRMPDPLAAAQVVDCGWPYKTRMTVRRPADLRRFNGTANVEWYNVSIGQDIDFVWAATHDYQMRHGYVSVSISAQLNGVNALREWSPARYGSLTLTAPNTDPSTGGPLDQTGDVLSWDVFSQTVQGLRHPGGVDPLPGLTVKRVIANGESQSALRLTPYYNSIDPLHHVVDGIVYYDAAGKLRTDSATKAISVATEIGVGLLPPSGLPAPDSTNYRRWEVAGTTHVSLPDMDYVDPMTLRDGFLKLPDGTPTSVTGGTTGCAWYPLWSPTPTGYVLDSAFDHVNNWIRRGTSPPTAPRMERDPSAPPVFDPSAPGGVGPALAHDANGTTLGGIQLAQYADRFDFIKGAGNTGPGACWLAGTHRPLTNQELAARYPDPRQYLRESLALTARNTSNGFILREDAARTISETVANYRRLVHLR